MEIYRGGKSPHKMHRPEGAGNFDNMDDTNFVENVNAINISGATIYGANVTSGTDPGHDHTSASIADVYLFNNQDDETTGKLTTAGLVSSNTISGANAVMTGQISGAGITSGETISGANYLSIIGGDALGTPTPGANVLASFQNTDTTTSASEISLVGGSFGVNKVNFGRQDDEDRAALVYNNQQNKLKLWVGTVHPALTATTNRVGINEVSPSVAFVVDYPDDTIDQGAIIKNSDGEIFIGNGTATANNNSPKINFTPSVHTNRGALIRTQIDPTVDSGTTPLLQIDGEQSDNTDVTDRPLVKFTNNSTTFLQLEADGDLKFVGAGGLPFGSLYAHELTVTKPLVQNEYHPLSGAGLFTAGNSNNVTAVAVSGALVINTEGMYKVDWSLSCESATASQDIDVDLFINEVEQSDGAARRVLGAANDKGNMGATAILDCAVDDKITLRVKNNTGSNSIIVYDANINCVQVGGT